jgi:hypothetical protein
MIEHESIHEIARRCDEATRLSYDPGSPSGLTVARRLWERVLVEVAMSVDSVDDFIFVPISVSDDTYGFSPIHKSHFSIDVPMAAGRYIGTLTNVREDERA